MNVIMPATSSNSGASGLIDVMTNHVKHFVPKTVVLQVQASFLRAENHMQLNAS